MSSVFRRSRYRYRRARTGQQPFFQGKGEGEHVSPEGGQSFFGQTSQPTIQTKLTIGQPNDKYEREADTMADRVVNHQPAGQFGALATPTLQTKCADCAEEEGVQRMAEEEEPAVQTMQEEEPVQRMEEEEPALQMQEEEEVQAKEEEPEVQAQEEEEEAVQTKPQLMRKAAGGRSVGTPALASQLSNSKGGGQPMSPGVQAQMSQSFGRDFGAVRIHTGSRAAEMNEGLQARAFTHGTDVYFKSGEYRPESTEGKRLLAHELTHVIQQKGGDIKRESASKSSGSSVKKKPERLIIWLNAFIPGSVKGVTKKAPKGKGSMVEGPPLYECFLTDNRGFSSSSGASYRMQHAIMVDLATLNVSPITNMGATHEIDCDTGKPVCTSMAGTGGMKTKKIMGKSGSALLIVDMTGAASNPCVKASPNIDYRMWSVEVNTSKRQIKVEGFVDDFPAFEMYAVSTAVGKPHTLFTRFPASGKGPFSLFGGAGNAVKGTVYY